jgi:hypothetical protein
MMVGDDLASHDGMDACLFGRLDEVDEAVKSVRVGEGELVHALLPGGSAEVFHRTHAPSGRVVGMNIEMDKLHVSPQRHKGHRGELCLGPLKDQSLDAISQDRDIEIDE